MVSNPKLCLGVIFAAAFQSYLVVSSTDIPSCESLIYCQGELLEVVQTSEIFTDSKTFVDQRMLFNESTVLNNFQYLMNNTQNKPNLTEVQNFVESNFGAGDELEPWILPDYHDNPVFLNKVYNETLRNFTQEIVKIWPTLAKKIKQEVYENIDRYSIIPVPNGFIVPGGRFLETYYWDSYWIIKGLLISEMPETARNMIENFLFLVEKFGFVPNGSRVYYLNRSHPPLLTAMVKLYVDATNNLSWLKEHVSILEKELKFFIQNRSLNIVQHDEVYQLAHYDSESHSPRSESYREDAETCSSLKTKVKIDDCYADLKTGAESGWDFSFRWVFDQYGGNQANRSSISTRRSIPVELNSMLAKAFKDLAYFYERLGNSRKQKYWSLKFLEWKLAIHEIFYNESLGAWFDYDVELKRQRQYFYPTNIAPLWLEIYEPETAQLLGRKAYEYLLDQGVLKYYGGTPTSFNRTGEQWDYPSAWAPLQSMIIQGLHKSGDDKAAKMAKVLAQRWIESNLIGFQKTGNMYEKYDAEHPGESGGGGEYVPQTGFGWTNGVVLETVVDFFSESGSE